jgi:hypothetical protein
MEHGRSHPLGLQTLVFVKYQVFYPACERNIVIPILQMSNLRLSTQPAIHLV